MNTVGTKAFHIGEYAIGGTIFIKIDTNEDKSYTTIDIQFREFKKETPIYRAQVFNVKDDSGIMNFLEDGTSYYFAEKVFKWLTLTIKKLNL